VIIFIVSLISGIISGMGIGGGTILIPALIIFFNIKQHIAQSTNLIIFIPTSIVALYFHTKQGNVVKDVLKNLIIFGIIGSIIGSFLAVSIKSDMLKKMFGIFLLIMGAYEIYLSKKEKAHPKQM